MVDYGRLNINSQDHGRVIICHGGAGPQDPKGQQAQVAIDEIKSILSSLDVSPDLSKHSYLNNEWQNLDTSLKTVLSTISRLEDSPVYNAGFGASLQSDGAARLSAAYMNSEQLKLTGVINVKDLRHPSWLAWWLQRQRFGLLDQLGAEIFIRELNIPKQETVTKMRFESWCRHKFVEIKKRTSHGAYSTVGSIVCDGKTLHTLTSTGGVGNEHPGRVGDSPTIAGTFCTPDLAVSCTGLGEQITGYALAPRIALHLGPNETLKQRFEYVFSQAESLQYEFAAIALRKHPDGYIEWAAGTSHCELTYGVRLEKNLSQFEIVLPARYSNR
jgi:L-asparaginase